MEFNIALKNGAIRTLSGQGELQMDSENNPARLIGTVQNITERKISEKRLINNEEKYRSLVETTHEIIFSLNRLNYLTYANQRNHPINLKQGRQKEN